MARRPRQDHPDSGHHVINRGLAKRPLFEDREDIRFFLSRLAHEVRRGRIEVHAWCVLTTHFRPLVRSQIGEVSEALRRSQNVYSRFLNRGHRRNGTLVRGRFFSKPVAVYARRAAEIGAVALAACHLHFEPDVEGGCYRVEVMRLGNY